VFLFILVFPLFFRRCLAAIANSFGFVMTSYANDNDAGR